MYAVKIVTPGPGAQPGFGTKVFAADGVQIPFVSSINISIEPNSVITAEIGVYVGKCDIYAHPLLTLDSLKEAAAQHGYVLTPKLDNLTAPLDENVQVRASAPQSPPPPKPRR